MSRLDPRELDWRDKQPWLLSRGYQLRARYQPDWVPSWPPGADYSTMRASEDFVKWRLTKVIDAIRLSDNKPVVLKKIFSANHPTNQELRISEYFQSTEQRQDPDNHCVHILEVLKIPDDDDSDYVIIAMPLLCPFDFPRFDTIGECLDFFQQNFKGLRYLHRHHIAHRDCTGLNVLMDPSEIFPDGFHPVKPEMNREYTGPSYQKYTRTQRPPRYYWIDFGLSRRFHPSDPNPLVPGMHANDKSAPELRVPDPLERQHDPFPTDIYYLGNLVRMCFTEGNSELHWGKKYGFGFMKPLVEAMIQEDPTKRPTIEQCVVFLEEIIRSQSSWTLRSQVWHSTDNVFGFLYRLFPHWIRRITYIVTLITPAIPRSSTLTPSRAIAL